MARGEGDGVLDRAVGGHGAEEDLAGLADDGGGKLEAIIPGRVAHLAVDDARGWLYVARNATIERISLSTGVAELFTESPSK